MLFFFFLAESIKVVRNAQGYLICPVCAGEYIYADDFERHVHTHNQNNEKSLEDDATGNVTVSQVDDILPTTDLPTTKNSLVNTAQEYHNSLLLALDVKHLSPDNAENRLLAAQLVDAHPLLFKDHHGEHHYLLGTPRNISRVLESQFDQPFTQFQSFLAPNKRTFKEMIGLEGNLEPVNHTPQFDQAISLTRWKKWSDKKSYMELTDSICKFLNADWTRRRWLAYYCSRIFEGAILVNHGQCLLVNCTEIYPRLPCLDVHFERFKQVHQRSPASSIPEDDDAQYPDVQVCVMENDNTNKLVIGTKSFNALLTSTIRLDVDHIPTIGASSINGFSPTKATRIYLDQRVVKMLNEWVEKKKIEKNAGTALVNYPLYVFDELAQLRQVRSKFNDPSTYQFLRGYSSVTNDLRLRPITVWTLADTSPTNGTTND
ncbi:hypothetical protein EC973_008144 [Apophysomyces ossiformis]|uniref:C2H2-type domain-containing protein n=1 Tax=Apophysomyces ossiformis TaxID=679940 RepID=A0A8H7EKJ8_9FUNG|nr:hypothetical protein EC973_008144 [Apophysomyces ossiformis]